MEVSLLLTILVGSANVVFVIIGIGLFCHYRLEREAIEKFARKSVEGTGD